MAESLTQEQIDEMLKNVAAGVAPVVSQKEEEKVKDYDFRAPKKFTKEQIKVLDGIFENYARLLSSYFTGLLRLYCRVSLVNIEEQRYSEFNNALPDYVLMGMVDMGIKNEEVSETTVIVQISNTITFTMIDRLLGGRGEFRDVNRDFTEIEITIMNDVMNQMANLLYKPWASHIELEPKLIGIETNSRVVQTIVPSLLGQLRVAIILLEQADGLAVAYANHYLALLSVLTRSAVGLHQVYVVLGVGHTHRSRLGLNPRHGSERHGGLGLAESLHHLYARQFLELIEHSGV